MSNEITLFDDVTFETTKEELGVLLSLGKRSIQQSLKCGGMLTHLKKKTPIGKWGEERKKLGLSETMDWRLRKAYQEQDNLVDGMTFSELVNDVKSFDSKEEPEEEEPIQYAPIITIGEHVLIHADNKDVDLTGYDFGLCFCDPPYNSTDQQWDGGFLWEHDFLLDHCDILAITPGISEIANFLKVTSMI
jgi:hypothetical protein